MMSAWTAVLAMVTAVWPGSTPAIPQSLSPQNPRAPLVMLVGCAAKTPQPHIWDLTRAGPRVESSRAGITTTEKSQFERQPLGRDAYQLIGVGDFVDAETSRTIGDRGRILTSSRVNATGMLASGHKVGVKGLFIDASPPRINLTSVVDLGPCS